MKKVFYIIVCLALLACHESLEERAVREAQEFTRKNCPQQLDGGMVYDSLVFATADTTLYSYYTISGDGDDKAVVDANRDALRASLLRNFRNDVGTKRFKEAGFGFGVVIHSQKNPGKELYRIRFSQRDLQ